MKPVHGGCSIRPAGLVRLFLAALVWLAIPDVHARAAVKAEGVSNEASSVKPTTPAALIFYPPMDLPGLHTLVDGQPHGLYPDLIEAIAQAANIRAELRSLTWPGPLEAVRSGDGDVLGPVMGTPSSFTDLLHTQPIMRVEWARFVRTGDSRANSGIGYKGVRVAVLSDSVGTRWLSREHPSAVQVPVDSIQEGLAALIARDADALLTLRLPTRYIIGRSGEERVEEVGVELTAAMSLALSPRAAAALPHLNAAIEQLTASGEIERVRNRWLMPAPRTAAEIAEDRLTYMLAAMVVILMVLTVVLGVYNRRLVRARFQAEAAREAKSNFLAVMSHEIRTPINGLVNLIDLLQRGPTTPEQAGLLQKAEQANRSLLTLVNQVLDYSKIESSRMEIRPSPMRLHSLMDRVQAVLSAQPRQAAVALQFDELPVGPVWVLADEHRLSQVLINLGGNALKFTQQGRVSVSVSTLQPPRNEQGHWRLRFEVQDTGPGIPRQDLDRLFKPFVQLKAGLDRPHAGTGLGLSTSAELVRQMGGELQVRSDPGRLTTFWFDLAVQASDEQPAEEVVQTAAETAAGSLEAPPPVAAAPRCMVWVVDDNPLNLLVTRKILEQEGYAVQQADSATVALAMVQQAGVQLPDLILMDLHMPELDGVEATRRLRQALGDRMPPVLAVTGAVTDDTRQAALEAGMAGFLPKPFDRRSLLAAIAALQNH